MTGSPEMLGGRVKTLHPKIHGGILADRSKPEHRRRPGSQRHRGHRSRGLEPLPVLVGPLRRADRHRRSGDGAGRRQEPRARRDRHLAGRYPVVLEELRAAGSLSAADAPAAGPRRLRAHRGLRRGHRGLARRGGPPVEDTRRRHRRRHGGGRAVGRPAPDAAPDARAHRGAALRREPTPARLALPLAGRRAGGTPWSARRDPAVVPQPLRRRCGLAPGARAGGGRRRRAGGRGHHQARQPVWRRGGRRPGHRLRAGARCDVRACSGAWWPSAATSPPRWPRPSPRVRG